MAKILIVDDDVLIASLIETAVSTEGHQPTIVNDSSHAYEAASSIKPDLITLDIMMPGLDGIALCALLHADSKFADTPIMIISAKGDAESKEKASKAGAKDFITKPFRISDLIQRMEALILNTSRD